MSFGFACVSMAQDAGPAGGAPKQVNAPGAKRPGPMMIERQILGKLNLTPEQKAKFRELFKKVGTEMKEARKAAGETLDKSVMKAKREAIMKDYRQSVGTILTPDQMKQYEQLHKEYMEKVKAAKGNGGTIKPL